MADWYPAIAEIVPLVLAIGGVMLMKRIFPKRKVDEFVEKYGPALNDDGERETLRDMVERFTEGWQVTVDLIYNMMALIAVLICRLVGQEGFTFRSLSGCALIVFLFFTTIILAVCLRKGPLESEAIPWSIFRNPKWTWGYCAYKGIIYSNLVLIITIAVDVVLRGLKSG